MHFREALLQALRTLRAERLRSFLTMFGIVWGTAAVVFLMSWGIGVQRMLEAGLSRAGKNLVMAWAGKIGEDYTPAGDRRELWFTRADVDAVRRRVRLAEAVVGEGRFWGAVSHGQTTLSTDDNDGRGSCSLIDGTGGPDARDPGAGSLPGGTYYLRIEASPDAQLGPDGQFDYRLAITVR